MKTVPLLIIQKQISHYSYFFSDYCAASDYFSAVIEQSTNRSCHRRLCALLIRTVKYCTNDLRRSLVEGDKLF